MGVPGSFSLLIRAHPRESAAISLPAACPCRLPLRITPAVCLYRPHSALLRVTTLLNRR